MKGRKFFIVAAALLFCCSVAAAQDVLPADNGLATYHTAPRYRESESHPLRVAAYAVHPIGWLMREVVFRPISYLTSSTETTRSIFGFREPYDYRQPECFSADDSAPDCRSVMPFNYDSPGANSEESVSVERTMYFPDVNFDFDRRALNELGEGRAHQLAKMLADNQNVKVVLQGHADYKGENAYNEKLGLDRADAVKKELVALGVSTDRLSTVTFGETQPILPEEENWARAVNRRVEVHPGE